MGKCRCSRAGWCIEPKNSVPAKASACTMYMFWLGDPSGVFDKLPLVWQRVGHSCVLSLGLTVFNPKLFYSVLAMIILLEVRCLFWGVRWFLLLLINSFSHGKGLSMVGCVLSLGLAMPAASPTRCHVTRPGVGPASENLNLAPTRTPLRLGREE